ncbi:hypothetical protein ACFWOJ_04965 [Streptomyces sp. NPDC058439]|uniref:hypothetical protein n=1 Tax=Streptomyces sp. NPDC058439 TaxID=3346500 RepID=UPI00365D79D2
MIVLSDDYVFRRRACSRGDRCRQLPRTVIASHSAGITADEDIVMDFAACWEAMAARRVPDTAVDVGRGY